MSGFLIDTNVLLDIATADATWMPRRDASVAGATGHGGIRGAGRGAVFINPIIYAELAPAFASAG